MWWVTRFIQGKVLFYQQGIQIKVIALECKEIEKEESKNMDVKKKESFDGPITQSIILP